MTKPAQHNGHISMAAFARYRRVSRTRVRQWKANGLLSLRDGMVDVQATDRLLAARAAQVKRRKAEIAAAKALKPVPKRAWAVNQVFKQPTVEPTLDVPTITMRLRTRAANLERDAEVEIAADIRRAIALINDLDARLREAQHMLDTGRRLSAVSQQSQSHGGKRSRHSASEGY